MLCQIVKSRGTLLPLSSKLRFYRKYFRAWKAGCEGCHFYVPTVSVCSTIPSSKIPHWKLVARTQFGQLFKSAGDTNNTAVSRAPYILLRINVKFWKQPAGSVRRNHYFDTLSAKIFRCRHGNRTVTLGICVHFKVKIETTSAEFFLCFRVGLSLRLHCLIASSNSIIV